MGSGWVAGSAWPAGGRAGRGRVGAAGWADVGAEHAVGDQTKTRQVREPGPLGDAGQDRQVEHGVQPRDGEVVPDGAFESGARGRPGGGSPLAALASAALARSPSRCQNHIGSKPTATTTQSKAMRSRSCS